MEVEVEMELAVCCRTSKVWRGGIYRPCQPLDYGIIGSGKQRHDLVAKDAWPGLHLRW